LILSVEARRKYVKPDLYWGVPFLMDEVWCTFGMLLEHPFLNFIFYN
jgi:hypothetical protein